MILIEVTEFWMWIILSVIVGMAITVLFFILVSPKQVRAFIKARLLKRLLLMVTSDSGSVDFKTAKIGPEGQVKIGRNDIKMIPRGANPILARQFHLKGYGIPYFETYDGSTVAVNPATSATMEIASTPKKDREKLPPKMQKWAKQNKIPITTKTKKGGTRTRHESLFSIDPRRLVDFFKGKPSRSQYEAELEKRERIGEKKAGKQYMKAALPIMGILSILIVGILLLMPMLR